MLFLIYLSSAFQWSDIGPDRSVNREFYLRKWMKSPPSQANLSFIGTDGTGIMSDPRSAAVLPRPLAGVFVSGFPVASLALLQPGVWLSWRGLLSPPEYEERSTGQWAVQSWLTHRGCCWTAWLSSSLGCASRSPFPDVAVQGTPGSTWKPYHNPARYVIARSTLVTIYRVPFICQIWCQGRKGERISPESHSN